MCNRAIDTHTKETVHILDADNEAKKGDYRCTYCEGILIPKFPTEEQSTTKSKEVRIFSLEEIKDAIEYAKNNKKEEKQKEKGFTPHFAHLPEERDIWASCPEATANSDLRDLDFAYKYICDLNANGKYIIKKMKHQDIECIEITAKDETVYITTQRPSHFSSLWGGRIITIRKWRKWKGYGLIKDSNNSIGAIWVNNGEQKRIAYSYKRQKRDLNFNGYVMEFSLGTNEGFIITAPNKTISDNGIHVKCDYVTSYVTLDQVMSGDKISFPDTVIDMHPDEVKRLISENKAVLEKIVKDLQVLDVSPPHILEKRIEEKKSEMMRNWKENEELNILLGIEPEEEFIPGRKNKIALEIEDFEKKLRDWHHQRRYYVKSIEKYQDELTRLEEIL